MWYIQSYVSGARRCTCLQMRRGNGNTELSIIVKANYLTSVEFKGPHLLKSDHESKAAGIPLGNSLGLHRRVKREMSQIGRDMNHPGDGKLKGKFTGMDDQ